MQYCPLNERGSAMSNERTTVYAVRERDGLRCWFKKRDKHGVFLDSSLSKARLYGEKNAAESTKCLLNKAGYKYKDGTSYVFEVVEVAA